MVSLQCKTKKGQKYWYLVKSERVKGKPRIVWQQYLGTAEAILGLKKSSESLPYELIRSYSFGKTAAFLSVSEELGFVESVDKHVGAGRGQGLSVGGYLLLNIIGRSDGGFSENAMQKWFNESALSLLWGVNHSLSCQNFLNQYKHLTPEVLQKVEDDLCKSLVDKGLTPEVLFLDESNWFNYIEKTGKLPCKGKNKKHRGDKNQVSMGLAVSGDNIPFLHEVYEGNKHDSQVFPLLVESLVKRLGDLKISTEHLVLVFDKGNNSEKNIAGALSKMHLIASAKHNEAKDLLDIPLEKYEFLYTNRKEHKISGYKTTHEFYGKEFTTVISYNEASYKRQSNKYEEDKKKILEKLADLQKRLLAVRERKRSNSSIEREINDIIRKDFRPVIEYVLEGYNLTYKVKEEVEALRKQGFGKTIIFTDLSEWDTKKIVETYGNKYLIEDDFKMLNNVLEIPIGPVNHHIDHNIRVHITLCVYGMMFHRYLYWKLRKQKMSPKQILAELEGIRIAVVRDKETKKTQIRTETMNTKQATMLSELKLEKHLLQ